MLTLARNNIHLYKRLRREDSHFKIVDTGKGDKYTLVDEPHGIDEGKRKSLLLLKGYGAVADELQLEFNEKPHLAKSVTNNNIFDEFSDSRTRNEFGDICGFIKRPRSSEEKARHATDEEIVEMKACLDL